MFKKLTILLVPVILSSCAWLFGSYEEEFRLCPSIDIVDETLIQKAGPKDEFRLEIIGVDGFCYVDEKTGVNKAVINPVIKITRSPGSNDTDVHFAYYTDSIQGPPHLLGKKVFRTSTFMPRDSKEVIFRPKQVEREVSASSDVEYDLKLGFVISPAQRELLRRSR